MKETALRNHFYKLMEFSPHTMLRLHNGGETVSTIYAPHKDGRFTSDMFNGTRLNEKGKKLIGELGVMGINRLPPAQAEKMILESQNHFR